MPLCLRGLHNDLVVDIHCHGQMEELYDGVCQLDLSALQVEESNHHQACIVNCLLLEFFPCERPPTISNLACHFISAAVYLLFSMSGPNFAVAVLKSLLWCGGVWGDGCCCPPSWGGGRETHRRVRRIVMGGWKTLHTHPRQGMKSSKRGRCFPLSCRIDPGISVGRGVATSAASAIRTCVLLAVI